MEFCHTPHFILTDCHLFFPFLTLCASITALFWFLLVENKIGNLKQYKYFQEIQIALDLDGVQMTIQVGDSQS